MRRSISILLVTFFICFTSKANEIYVYANQHHIDTIPPSTLSSYLQQMNISLYYGKAVDSFIVAVPATPYQLRVYGGTNSQGAYFRASYLWYKYNDGSVVRVYVREFTHMNRYSPTATWDTNLFRQEKIFKISVYGPSGTCINGDCMN